MSQFRQLSQCEFVTGHTHMVSYLPAELAQSGRKALHDGEVWEIVKAYPPSESSQYIAWYIPFDGRVA